MLLLGVGIYKMWLCYNEDDFVGSIFIFQWNIKDYLED